MPFSGEELKTLQQLVRTVNNLVEDNKILSREVQDLKEKVEWLTTPTNPSIQNQSTE